MDRSEGERRGAVRPGDQPESEGAVCQWHTSSADRANGETAARCEQAQREWDSAEPS